MYPLKTDRDMRRLKWQFKVRNVPKKRLPAIVIMELCGRSNKERAGVRWDGVDEKVRNYIGGNQEEMLSAEKLGGVQGKSRRTGRKQGKATAALRNELKSDELLEIYGGLKGRI